MGWQNEIAEYLSTELFLPAVGQGAVAVEIRAEDMEIANLASVINEELTWLSVSAERAFLRALGGGCRAPIAALSTVVDHTLLLEGMVARIDGTKVLRAQEEGSPAHPEEVGILLGEKILRMGGRQIIEESQGEGSG
jgi:hydroxymethylbilane synthase